MRLWGCLLGFLLASTIFHELHSHAMEASATTVGGRVSEVFVGVLLLMIFLFLCKKYFVAAFYHGFIVAVGLFLSFDIVVFHWILKLHRLTSGPEANFLEPIFVLFGCALLYYGISKERRRMRNLVK